MDFDLNIVFLMGYIVFSEVRNYWERREMMNRVMAKNLTEYVISEPKRVKIPDRIPKDEGYTV
jgi:hypothetical protein